MDIQLPAPVNTPPWLVTQLSLVGPADPDESSWGDILCGSLWFIVIAFMFFAQHHTCDAYFVPAINVFVDKMKASPSTWLQRWGESSVAGATICALGCNGPELFSNLISLYTGSDAGIGVVVGSEIFNLLVITGCSVLAAPVVPLALERFSFVRDSIAYGISIVLLYNVLADRKVTFHESTMLLSCALVYVIAVYFTKDVENCLSAKPEEKASKSNGTTERKRRPSFAPDPNADADRSRPSQRVSVKHVGTLHGVQVEVEEILHGRMVDGHHGAKHTEIVDAQADGIHHTEICPTKGFQLESSCEEALLGPMFDYDNLKEVVVMGQGVIELEFEKAIMHGMLLEHITLKMTTATAADRDSLLEQITTQCGKAWVHAYDATVVGGWDHFKHMVADPDMSLFLKIFLCVPELIIDSFLRLTLFAVDIKDITKENRWPVCFFGAMCWLAFFSWCMLECANMINFFIPKIPTAFLGITVCAVGTSFPNAVASVILSSQGKPAAAIANALGSNIQNVFLAMAFPWVIYQVQATDYQPIPQNVAGIQEGVAWMVGTLLLLLLIVLVPPCCKITKVCGILLNIVYGVYLVVIGGETFGLWPPMIK